MTSTTDTRTLGTQAETLAWHHLRQHGLEFEHRNYRCHHGEIDLIVRQQDLLVFVEVKSRNDDDLLSALEMVSRTKQQRIVRTAQHYLGATGRHRSRCRFDVIAITRLDQDRPELTWIKDAFFAVWN